MINISVTLSMFCTEELWNWILKLDEEYPLRNYNRATKIPEPYQFVPPELNQTYRLVVGRIRKVLAPRIGAVEAELESYKGFIENVEEYEQELEEEFERILNGSGNSDVDTAEQSNTTTKNFLKNVRKDLSKLLKKYHGDGALID
ncbi:MAG TPA: hypothetical protein VFI70_10200 [Nitrososphaeraceae archaeon]|nr:hypothetical protein [Nitrososphaeraceae archaeon]